MTDTDQWSVLRGGRHVAGRLERRGEGVVLKMEPERA